DRLPDRRLVRDVCRDVVDTVGPVRPGRIGDVEGHDRRPVRGEELRGRGTKVPGTAGDDDRLAGDPVAVMTCWGHSKSPYSAGEWWDTHGCVRELWNRGMRRSISVCGGVDATQTTRERTTDVPLNGTATTDCAAG